MKSLLRKSAKLATLFMFAFSFAQQPNYPTQAQNAELNYSDLENFVNAFKVLEKDTDTIETFNKMYFEKASIGLKEFVNRHGLTAQMLKKAVAKNPDKYRKIETFIEGLDELKPKLVKVLKDFQNIVPNTMFAPTYLLVGANRGIAQASQFGQLVTITRLLKNEERLLQVIIHELAHFQQAKTLGGPQYVALYSKPNNMLGICLREGGAEFITDQVFGSITQSKSIDYYVENEVELKQKFLEDLKSQDNSFWLWDSVGKKDYPQLLGYVMGYKIWKNYYNKAGDSDQVIGEILNLKDPDKYIEKSDYFSAQ